MGRVRGYRGPARLAGLLLAGAVALVGVPAVLVDAGPAPPTPTGPNDDGWTNRPASTSADKPTKVEDDFKSRTPPAAADDGWNSRAPKTVIPTGGQAPTPPRPDRLPDSLVPVRQPKDDPPTPKVEGPVLPAPKKAEEPTLPPPKPVDPPRRKTKPKDPVKEIPPATAAEDPDKALLLAAARNAVRAGDWDLAVARFEEALRRFGDDPVVRAEYAGVLTQAGRLKEALKAYAQAVAGRPNDVKMRVEFGDVAVFARDYPLAILQFCRALDLTPDDPEIAVRLARAYVFDGNPAAGQATYDRLLNEYRPGDDDVPNHLPTLLVDLDRPTEALAFITHLLKDRPDDAELLAAQVRAHGRLYDRPKALEALTMLDARIPKDLRVRRELAEALYGSEDYELAAAVYEQMVRIDPGNQVALIGLARVKAEMFQPLAVRAILDGFRFAPPNERAYRLACADFHKLVGEWAEAREVYRAVLERDPDDHEVRFALANLYERAREDEKAKAEYSKIPPGSGLARRARLGVAAVLTLQRRFAEGAEVSKVLLAENPADAAPLAQLVRTMARGDLADPAVAMARAWLSNNPRNELGRTTVLHALGRALLDGRKPQEAARVFDQLHQRPGGRTPEAFYGLARSLGMTGDEARARAVAAAGVAWTGGETRNRLLLADLFAGDFDDPTAADLITAAAKCDPENLAVKVRLAEVQGRLSRPSGDIHQAAQTAREVLERSPTNYRGRLALARTLSTGQHWKDSAAEYQRLSETDPDMFVPQRERARVLYSGNEFTSGAMAYQRLQNPPADEQLRAALAGLAQKDARLGLVLNPCLAAAAPARVVKVEVAKAVAAMGDPALTAELNRHLLDYEAKAAEQTLAKLEGCEKDVAWKPYAVIPPAKALLELEPANTSALFDLGQAYATLGTRAAPGQAASSMGQTRAAIATYSQELHIDPREREAAIALERAGLELQPQLRPESNIFAQRGRDGLARIIRTSYGMSARLPFGDEDEFCEVGYAKLGYHPSGDRTLDGNAFLAAGQVKPVERLLTYGRVRLETYTDRFGTRPNFDIGYLYDCTDVCRLRGSLFLENVAENGETLRQDIYRYGMRLGADYRATRRWYLTGTYTIGHYSDENDYHDLLLTSEHTLFFAPTQLKAVVVADINGYREQTVFGRAGPTDLTGTLHPYFSPDLFGYTEARLEWTQWLSRDYFAHSNQCWYSLQLGIGLDTLVNRYHTLRAVFHYDVKPWLSVEAEARATLSRDYDMAAANAYVIFRLPDVK